MKVGRRGGAGRNQEKRIERKSNTSARTTLEKKEKEPRKRQKMCPTKR